MHPTPDADINEHLDTLLEEIQSILRDKLVGLYLFGSLVTGDFERGTSDIDLLAVTTSDIDPNEFEQLDRMQNDFLSRNPELVNRLEIAYVSAEALKTYKWRSSNIGIISPGEPFHIKEAGKDWLLNWYVVRAKGLALYGPPPQEIIDPITQEEYRQAIKAQASEWRDWVYNSRTRPSQAYSILTMCRALYSYRTGEQASKKQAALWAQKELPEWSPLIQNALRWRKAWREENVDHEATYPETVRFVHTVIDMIVGC